MNIKLKMQLYKFIWWLEIISSVLAMFCAVYGLVFLDPVALISLIPMVIISIALTCIKHNLENSE